jgi:succinyl-diaminopimelate desuccinylase
MADRIANWLVSRQDPNDGGITGGLNSDGSERLWTSTEHNLDAYFALKLYSVVTSNSFYLDKANRCKGWLLNVGWNAAEKRFNTGENDPSKFALREDKDRLIGPGVFDMKASAAVMMELLHEIDAKKLSSRVMFQFVPEEEIGGHEGTGYLVKKGYTGSFVICCEPTHLKISVQSKGAIFIKGMVRGRAAHGSRPWLGDNAILKALRLYQDLQTLPYLKASSELFKCGTANLTKIIGGDSINKVPDWCEIYLDCRYLPGQREEEVLDQIASVFNRHEATHEIIRSAHPVVTPVDHDAVLKLHTICKKYEPTSVIFGQDGTSDAHFFSPLGIPGIEFGPTGGGQHSTEEYVEYSKLLIYKKVLKEFIENYGR